MNEPDLSRAQWRKSSHSSANGQCVEVAHLDRSRRRPRLQGLPTDPKLIFTRQEWAAFIRGIKNGNFSVS